MAAALGAAGGSLAGRCAYAASAASRVGGRRGKTQEKHQTF